MTESEILAKVADIVGTQFSLDKSTVTATTGPEEVEAWDSLTHVALTSELENSFGVSFEIEEIMEMENVAAIVGIIHRKLGR